MGRKEVRQPCDFLRSVDRRDFRAAPFFLRKDGRAEVSLCNPLIIRKGKEPLYHLGHGIYSPFGVDAQAVQK